MSVSVDACGTLFATRLRATPSSQLFTVLGLAGVGKSRLVREFLADIEGQALVARGRCLPYGDGITFWPLVEAVREAVGLEDGDSPETARLKLSLALGESPDSGVAARGVAELIGFADAADSSTAGMEGFAATQALFRPLPPTGHSYSSSTTSTGRSRHFSILWSISPTLSGTVLPCSSAWLALSCSMYDAVGVAAE